MQRKIYNGRYLVSGTRERVKEKVKEKEKWKSKKEECE